MVRVCDSKLGVLLTFNILMKLRASYINCKIRISIMKKFLIILLMGLCLFSCSGQKANSDLFTKGKSVGVVSIKIAEASGLQSSIKNQGYLWTLNDSGNPAEIYLLNDKGEIVMTCILPFINNRDWEEIFIGPGPKTGAPYLYIADIGDNEAKYPYKILYRLEEPIFDQEQVIIEDVDTLIFSLPDQVRDSETMFFDSLSSTIYLISKREHQVKLYELKYPFEKDTLVAAFKVDLPFRNIVAADLSHFDNEFMMKSYEEVYYWKRKSNEPLTELLQRKPIKIGYEPEAQGESIAWKFDGSGFYTLSETTTHSRGELIYYQRK